MRKTSAPFTIRSLANHGNTPGQLRQAMFEAPPEANLVLLQSQAAMVRFPPVCPNCGYAAASTLRIERAFVFHEPDSSDSPSNTAFSINTFDVPFCDPCISQQRSELIALSPWTPLWRIVSEGEGFAGLVAMAIAGLFIATALSKLDVFLLLFAGVPVASGLALMWGPWKRSAYMSSPKPAGVDLAVDFTPFLSLAYEPAWLAFQFRSRTYAELFRDANAQNLWKPDGVEAQSAVALRKRESHKANLVGGAVFAVVLLWYLWREGLSQYIMPYLKP